MIIQSARLGVAVDLAALVRHVFAGPANEAITVLHGTAEDLGVMRRDAAAAGKKYALRHFKISPEAVTSPAEAARVMRDLAGEFGFAPERCVVVEHRKKRAGGSGYERHWHLLVPEWDPVRRRVLDSHWMRPRQEKIARQAELRLGHAPVTGRWNAAVARALTREGHAADAAAVARLAAGPRPRAAYGARRHQTAARRGVSLPEARLLVKAAWERSDDAAAFAAALAPSGLTLRPGDKAGVWLVEAAGEGNSPVLVGALHRLLRQPRRAVAARMHAAGPVPLPAPVAPVLPARRHRPSAERQWTEAARPPPLALVRHRAVRRAGTSPDREIRRRRWLARCLRQAYDLDWVPETIAARIRAVDWHAESQALILTLDTGTRLIDRHDRIDVVGTADDVAIAELVACVGRRGWEAVTVHGDAAFRAAATRALREAGIAVANAPAARPEAEGWDASGYNNDAAPEAATGLPALRTRTTSM